jgi:hypothetical protein
MAKKKKQIDTNSLKEYNLIDNVFFNAAEEKKKEENELKKYQIKKLSPFDVINMMYLNPSGFAQIKDELLEEYYFIINRRFAIMYPQQAAMMSRLKINQVGVVKFWANFARAMNRGRPGVPQWINTKGAKAMKDSRFVSDLTAHMEELLPIDNIGEVSFSRLMCYLDVSRSDYGYKRNYHNFVYNLDKKSLKESISILEGLSA